MPGRLVIYGAGWHGRSIAWIAGEEGKTVECFIDDAPVSTLVDGLPVRDAPTALLDEEFVQSHRFIVGIGDCQARWTKTKRLIDRGADLALVRHPSAAHGAFKIGSGSVIFPGAVLGFGCWIGRGCIVNNNTTIGHDCILRDGSSVCDGSNLGGSVEIGERAFLGLGVRVSPHIKIGEGAIVGSGAVVLKDVPPNVTVVGVPARIVRKNSPIQPPGEAFQGANL